MNGSETVKLYDIFSGTLDKDPLWILAVTGLSVAIDVMNRMAGEHPGFYFVFDAAHKSVVAQIGPRVNLVA
ncbi:MAG: hypothetical protein ACRD40_15450 [Candidatus Acidiferrales bacterium]